MCGNGDGLAHCGPRTITFYDANTGAVVTPTFLSYDVGASVLSIQSTSKSEVAIYSIKPKLTLDNYPSVVQEPYPVLTVTILAECVDTTFEPFILT